MNIIATGLVDEQSTLRRIPGVLVTMPPSRRTLRHVNKKFFITLPYMTIFIGCRKGDLGSLIATGHFRILGSLEPFSSFQQTFFVPPIPNTSEDGWVCLSYDFSLVYGDDQAEIARNMIQEFFSTQFTYYNAIFRDRDGFRVDLHSIQANPLKLYRSLEPKWSLDFFPDEVYEGKENR